MADVVDVAPGLLEEIEKDFKKQLKENKLIQQLLEKINQGKATYKEVNEYAIELGEILARAYQKNLNSNVLPDGKMYYNIAKRIIEPTMTNNYDLITNITYQVQETLNKQAKIGIKPITPDINQDRIDGIVNRVSYEDNFDDVSWILDEPIKNFSQSIVDDAIKANAEFHYESGMDPKIQRISSGNCCGWCNKLVGSYSYPKVPKDIYRRHDNCRCMVDYVVGKTRTNVHHGNTGKRRYTKDKYGDYVLTKEAKMQRAQELKATEKERKAAAREKRIATWQRKREEANKLEQHKKGKKVFITDQAINKVKLVGPKDYKEDTIKFLQETRKELLDFARKENYSNEVACLVDLNNNSKTNFVKGLIDSLDIEADTECYHWLASKEPKSLELLHNHPGLSYFSLNDINFFMNYSCIKSLSIVTNQGQTWYITKMNNFNFKKAVIEMLNCLERKDLKDDEVVELFLKRGYNFGVERN